MGTVRDKMMADLELRGFAAPTKKEYLRCAKNFVAYHHRSPVELGEPEVREFDGLMRSGTTRITDAKNAASSLESRFVLAYNAAHAFALVALRRRGYPLRQSLPGLPDARAHDRARQRRVSDAR